MRDAALRGGLSSDPRGFSGGTPPPTAGGRRWRRGKNASFRLSSPQKQHLCDRRTIRCGYRFGSVRPGLFPFPEADAVDAHLPSGKRCGPGDCSEPICLCRTSAAPGSGSESGITPGTKNLLQENLQIRLEQREAGWFWICIVFLPEEAGLARNNRKVSPADSRFSACFYAFYASTLCVKLCSLDDLQVQTSVVRSWMSPSRSASL